MSLKRLTGFKNISLEAKVSMAYAFSSIIQNCISILTLPFFARLLTTEQYGEYNIYISWSAILVIFITLNLPYGSFATAMVKFEDSRNEYISSAESICVLLSTLFLFIYIPFRSMWNNLLHLPTFIVVIMVLEKLSSAGVAFWSGKKRFEFKYKEVVAVTLLNAALAPAVAFILISNMEEKGYAMIIGYASVGIAINGFMFIYNLFKGKKLFVGAFWKYALGFNVPLIFYYLSQVVFNQSDRIMIEHYKGKAAAGIYGMAYSLAIILNFVLNAINNSYVPWLYGKIKEKKQEENRSVSCMLSILVAFLLSGVIWLAPEVIFVFGGEKYMTSIWVVPPVAMSVLLLFYSQFFINVEFYYERKGDLVTASIASAIINIVLNAWLIPVYGFVAAGYTTLFSYLIFTTSNYFAMKRVLREKGEQDNAYSYGILILIFMVFAVLTVCAGLLYNIPVVRYIIIALVLSVLALNHKKVISYINKIKSL